MGPPPPGLQPDPRCLLPLPTPQQTGAPYSRIPPPPHTPLGEAEAGPRSPQTLPARGDCPVPGARVTHDVSWGPSGLEFPISASWLSQEPALSRWQSSAGHPSHACLSSRPCSPWEPPAPRSLPLWPPDARAPASPGSVSRPVRAPRRGSAGVQGKELPPHRRRPRDRRSSAFLHASLEGACETPRGTHTCSLTNSSAVQPGRFPPNIYRHRLWAKPFWAPGDTVKSWTAPASSSGERDSKPWSVEQWTVLGAGVHGAESGL